MKTLAKELSVLIQLYGYWSEEVYEFNNKIIDSGKGHKVATINSMAKELVKNED